MKKYTLGCEFYFEIEADDYEEAAEKGWDFIHSNLPEYFHVDGAELWYEGKSEI